MDEVLFRSSQKLETLQVQLSLAASQSKDIFQQYSLQSKSLIIQAWNNSHTIQLKENIKDFLTYLITLGDRVRNEIWLHIDPQKLYYNLVKVFWQKWTKRDACFLGAGFICGGIVGICFALSIRKKDANVRYMQAVQCLNYLGVESATVIQNALAPYECGENDVLINVKAASVNFIDARICTGYGRTYRRILQKLHNKNYINNELPVTLGRDCTGIVTDIGTKVKRLEIGDEVWLTVPFWTQGTLSQSFLTSELRIGRKPKNIGFEGACSLPYSGSLALDALKRIEVNAENAHLKRILVIGTCTPVGCVLVQILNHWKANITATCFKRATPVAKALGVTDLIIFPELVNDDEKLQSKNLEFSPEGMKLFMKELEIRNGFDAIILTRECGLSIKDLRCYSNGTVISTLPQKLSSDSLGFLTRKLLEKYIHIKYFLEKLFGISRQFDEVHMCYMALDELHDLVENGHLQTVVDKVFHPEDIEIALNHIQSYESIGSTVITFR